MVLSVAAAENVAVYKGDNVVIADANWTLTWGQNYTFNRSGSTMYSDTYYMNMTEGPDRNISVTSDTAAQINTTLWEYNFDDLAFGDTLIELEVAADSDSTVDIVFTGVPSPDGDLFEVDVDGSTIEEFTSGGELSWSYSDWPSTNFTLTYRKQERDGSSADSSIDTFCWTDNRHDQHVWSATNRDQYEFDDVTVPNVAAVSVELATNTSEFRLCVEQLSSSPEEPEPLNDAYRYYRLTADTNQVPISTTTVRFSVNKSFADRYDIVTAARHRDGWNDLPTEQVDATNSTYVYETEADGFSYYAVRGVTTTTDTDTGDDKAQNDTETGEPATNRTPPVEDTPTDRDDGGGTGLLLLIGGIVVLILLGLGGWYGHRSWQQRIEHDLSRLTDQVNHTVDQTHDRELEHTLVTTLTAAENAYDNRKFWTAWKHINRIDKLLESGTE